MRAHEINALDNFMGGWYVDDETICDELIRFFHDSPQKRRGVMGAGGEAEVDTAAKDSTDVTLTRSPLATRYVRLLRRVAEHYAPGGGYPIWHFERDNSNDQIARRHLAYMTYLNDVQDGGGTEFLHQRLTVKAEKGLTLIWPVEWNFTHRGVVSPTQDKYIVTGWFSTYTREQFERVKQRLESRELKYS